MELAPPVDPATRIGDLFEPSELLAMIGAGYVTERRHPTYPYRILNYTDAAVYDGVWNAVTRQCRGLVVDDHGIVVARPFEKFHNHNEHDGVRLPLLDMAAPVTVTDKADGSLGILVPTPEGGHIIATRGSFTSEQAEWATKHYQAHYANDPAWQPEPGITYLFEIVYKANRIVVDYDFEDIVLIGLRNIASGEEHDPRNSTYPGPVTETFAASTLAEALAIPPRPNAEGVVVRYTHTGQRVKIKQDDYIRLHKIVTGLSERMVWEHMSAGGSFEDLIKGLPDEFHDWTTNVWDSFWEQFDGITGEATYRYMRILAALDDRGDRREFASYAKKQGVYAPLMFLLYDNDQERFDAAVWKRLRPVGDTRMWNSSQETAA